jgi:peptide/nickel transport system substrate-binding protein
MRILPRPTSPATRRAVPAALTAAALLAATACSAETTGSAAPGEKSATLALAIMGTPNSFAPTQLVDGQQGFVWTSLYDTLLRVDDKGELQPGAARSWKYSSDARALTLKLREGMKFSSGDPVTSAAVKKTVDAVRRTAGPNQAFLSSVSSVAAPDASTVVLKLKEPDGALLTSLAGAAGVIGDPKTMGDKSTALNPVGSGPYTLDKHATVNGSVYVLKRRNDYWDKKSYPFRTVKVRVISDRTAAVNALKAGEVNAGSVEGSNVANLEAAGFRAHRVKAQSTGTLVLADRAGSVLKPLADVRVRKAINMAFDRKKIVKQILRGAGNPTAQLFNPAGAAHDPALDKTYGYDPAAAKKLLAEAGYPNGFSVTLPGFVYIKPFEPTVTQSLSEIGIKVTWDAIPAQQGVSVLFSKKYPMFFLADGVGTAPIETQNFLKPDGSRNVFATRDPQLTDLLQRADAETDPAKAGDIYRQINSFAVREAWTAPIFNVGQTWMTKKGIDFVKSSLHSTVRSFRLADQEPEKSS